MAHKICPWYFGILLASPIRKLFQDPEKVLGSYIKEGMHILEIGPGMGFFTIPMANFVGENGRIVAVDVQEKMIRGLKKRAAKAGLLNRIDARICSGASLQIDDLAGSIDLAVLFAVVHEVPDQRSLFAEIHRALKKDGLLFITEPTGHVSKEAYEKMLALTKQIGFQFVQTPTVQKSHASLLKKG